MVIGIHLRKITTGAIFAVVGAFCLSVGGSVYFIEEFVYHDHSGVYTSIGVPGGIIMLSVGVGILAIGITFLLKGLSMYVHRFDSKPIRYVEGRPGVLEDTLAPGSEGAKNHCARCGEILLETMHICPSCGNPVN